MANPSPETAAVRARDDVRVPGSRQSRIILLVLALGEIVFLGILFTVTIATATDAQDAFGRSHSQVMLMLTLIAMPGALVRLLAVLLARASLLSAFLARAVCARGVWIVIAGVVLSVTGPVICLLNAGGFVPRNFSPADGDALIVSVMWTSASIISFSLVIGALEVSVIRAACSSAIKALHGGHAGSVNRSLTDL